MMDWIESTAVIVASVTAIYGINAWRRELRERRRMELAEEALTAIYEIKDAISSIRGVWSWAGEHEGREQHPNETADQTHARDIAYVVHRRYQTRSELFSRFHALRYRFWAVFGEAATAPFVEINRVVNELLSTAHAYASLAGSVGTEKSLEYHRKIYSVSSREEEDPFIPRINEATRALEAVCRPVLLGEGWTAKIGRSIHARRGKRR
jgi:hypothetical protein